MVQLIDQFRVGRALSTIAEHDDPKSPEVGQAVAALQKVGAPAVPRVVEALSRPAHASLLQRVLLALLVDDALPAFADALMKADPSGQAVIRQALARGRAFDPNRLLAWCFIPELPKQALEEILAAHLERLQPKRILETLGEVDEESQQILRRVIRRSVTPRLIPELLARLRSKDPTLRVGTVQTLSGLSSPEAREALLEVMGSDPSPEVRLCALEHLAEADEPPPIEPITRLLHDPEMVVRNRAIEVLASLPSEETLKLVTPMLEHDSVTVRRSAVEVLGAIGDESSIDPLARALGDEDWWVRFRVADSLAEIGGPGVIDALVPALEGSSDDLRDLVTGTLRRSVDDEAFADLLRDLELDDPDRRRRALEALAALGDARAVPSLVPMLDRDPQSAHLLIGALGQLGDARAIEPIVAQLRRSRDQNTTQHILKALRRLAEGENAALVAEALDQLQHDVAAGAHRQLSVEIRRHMKGSTPTPWRSTGQPMQTPSHPMRTPSAGIFDPLQLQPGQLLLDRYRVVRQVGRGGFGVVVLAKDEMISDEIILKFLAPKAAADDRMIQRFLQELRYARRITHPNVIRIFDLVAIENTYAITMEYFESHPLYLRMPEGRAVEIDWGLEVVHKICRGLTAAHAVGVVHRDLKPGNILIDEENRVKIVDFGLSAAAGEATSHLTQSGFMLGTPTYMSPEQIRGHELDARTDLYSLGIIMYQLFSGRPPYQGQDAVSILFQHCEGTPAPPSALGPIPAPLEALILKLMAPNPDERYQSVEHLQEALEGLRSELDG